MRSIAIVAALLAIGLGLWAPTAISDELTALFERSAPAAISKDIARNKLAAGAYLTTDLALRRAIVRLGPEKAKPAYYDRSRLTNDDSMLSAFVTPDIAAKNFASTAGLSAFRAQRSQFKLTAPNRSVLLGLEELPVNKLR